MKRLRSKKGIKTWSNQIALFNSCPSFLCNPLIRPCSDFDPSELAQPRLSVVGHFATIVRPQDIRFDPVNLGYDMPPWLGV